MTREEWLIIQKHDEVYDGSLWIASEISGFVCRPSCRMHPESARHLKVFHTLQEALDAGFGPCPHCHPERDDSIRSQAALAQSARQYIDAHYTEKFSLKELAGALFVDGSYLERVFKRETGSTLLWYHNYVRCEEAKRLLEDPSLPVAWIADQVGDGSPSHFSRIFRKYIGCSPTEYRGSYLLTGESGSIARL